MEVYDTSSMVAQGQTHSSLFLISFLQNDSALSQTSSKKPLSTSRLLPSVSDLVLLSFRQVAVGKKYLWWIYYWWREKLLNRQLLICPSLNPSHCFCYPFITLIPSVFHGHRWTWSHPTEPQTVCGEWSVRLYAIINKPLAVKGAELRRWTRLKGVTLCFHVLTWKRFFFPNAAQVDIKCCGDV